MSDTIDVSDDVALAARRSRVSAFVAGAVAVVVGLLIAFLAIGGQRVDDSPRNAVVGEVAPAIVGATTDGGTFDLDDHRGQWVVVNFFSTTCIPCIEEHPELIAFSEAHAAAGDATVVSVAFADTPRNVADFFEANGGDWPVLVDDTDSVAVDYAVLGVPESFLVSPAGKVAGLFTGGVTQADLDAFIGGAA